MHRMWFLLRFALIGLLIVAVFRYLQFTNDGISDVWIWFVLFGFVAQLIDGALGMAYGVSCTSFLLWFGIPPGIASAVVHIAEVFTTGFSGLAHMKFHNIDHTLFVRLLTPGIIGAVIGAYLISSVLDGAWMKPFVALYLLILGVVILIKAFRSSNRRHTAVRHVGKLAFLGSCMDMLGGGGWGPIVTSNLIHQGNDPRMTVGTVNAVEFFVTLAGSIVFLLFVSIEHWDIIGAIVLGGMFAAPIGAYMASRIARQKLMFLIGLIIIATSMTTLVQIRFG